GKTEKRRHRQKIIRKKEKKNANKTNKVGKKKTKNTCNYGKGRKRKSKLNENGIICSEPWTQMGSPWGFGYVKSGTHKQPMLFLSG
ncbi:hypothetical protein ACED98_11420, partial [Streptococcus thoraltensis]